MNDFSHSQTPIQGEQLPGITKTSDLAIHLDVPVRTVQRHLSRHARHVGATKMGKGGWVLGADSLRLLEKVRDLYRSGASQSEVEFSLTESSRLSVTRGTCATHATDTPSDLDELTASVEELTDEVSDFRVIIDDLQTENYNLRYEVDELKSTLETAEEERFDQKAETELLSEQVDRLEEMLTELLENEASQ